MARHLNTVRTLFGFIRAVLGRWFPSLSRNDRLDDIYNYVGIEGLYATSGQPSESQFQLIRDAGYDVVMGTAPSNSVVDSNMRSWEYENLYLLGAGSMPSIGSANTTLSLAALTFKASEQMLKDLNP